MLECESEPYRLSWNLNVRILEVLNLNQLGDIENLGDRELCH